MNENMDEGVCILCGKVRVVQTSWTDTNPGRRFVSCSHECRAGFKWVDPPMCHRSTQIIPGLLRRINRMRREVEEWKAAEMKMRMLLIGTWVMIVAVGVGKLMF
ncbi:hypothetical protein Vadar_025398 [Vaccinium darrowii]|uniref:Uncharacterized protein n=1 Tax=Vaccinium darrowii TaxID=229202 RepID=A0ACB7Y1M4_9ERIC|nr:hypothetical protein Vadar_025398 [Vaccinium darrowii]